MLYNNPSGFKLKRKEVENKKTSGGQEREGEKRKDAA